MTADTDAANRALADLTVCQSSSEDLAVTNRSKDVVWVVASPRVNNGAAFGLGVRNQLFRQVAELVQPGVVTVEPDITRYLPGPASSLRLQLDPHLQQMWNAESALKEVIDGQAEESFADAISGESRTKRVVTTCMLAGYDATVLATENSDDAASAIAASFNTGRSGTSCFDAIQELEAGDRAAGLRAPITTEALRLELRKPNWIDVTDHSYGVVSDLLSEIFRVAHR